MYLIIILKTIFLYFFILIVYRIMGKKEVGQLSIIDLIVSVLIAELAALSIDNNSILISVIPITVLLIIQVLFSYITLKSTKLRNVIDGKPTVIIKNGKLNFSEMGKLRYSLDDLMMQLREQGIKNMEEVKYAVLENNGKLSVFEKDNDYPMPIILDGVIDLVVVKEIGHDIDWIFNILKQKNVKLSDVFYAFYTKQKLFVIKKSDLV